MSSRPAAIRVSGWSVSTTTCYLVARSRCRRRRPAHASLASGSTRFLGARSKDQQGISAHRDASWTDPLSKPGSQLGRLVGSEDEVVRIGEGEVEPLLGGIVVVPRVRALLNCETGGRDCGDQSIG